MPTSLKKMETELKKIIKECDLAKEKYDSFAEKISGAELEFNFAKSSGDSSRINNTQNMLLNLENESLIAGDNLINLQNKASSLENSIKQIKMNPESSQEAMELSNNLNIMESKLQTSKDKANRLKDELNQTFNQNGNILSFFDSINGKLNSLSSKLKSSVSDKISDLNKKVTRFGKRISGLVASALIFNVLSKGLRNLASGFGNLLKSNNQFSSSLNQIKANLLTAFAPIYNYVLPAINTLMSALSSITGTIASFVSGLFGQTAEQSKKNASALYGQAKAYDKAGSSAKKASGNLASFDKLEVISDSSSDSNGSGQDNIDFSGQIEQSGKLLEFLNKIKELISEGQFYEIGKIIAEKINSALENIDWNKIKEKVSKIGVSIAEFLNGSIENIDWFLIGKTLAEGINTIIEFCYNFVETFNWEVFGNAIGNGINGFIKNIDWSKLGKTMSDFVRGLFSSLIQAIKTVDWRAIGDAIYDWFINIDWFGIIADVIVAISLALVGIGITIGELIVDAIGDMVDYFKPYVDDAGGDFIDGLLMGIWDGMKNIGKWLKENLIDPIVNGIKDMFGIHSPSTVMAEIGGFLVEGLKQGFNLEKIKEYFTKAVTIIKNVFKNIPDWFKDKFSKAWEAVKNVFSTGGKIFDGIKEGIANVFKTVVNGIIGGINKVISVPFKAINTMLNKVRDVNILGVSPFKSFWKQNPLTVPKIPMLAQGAVIPPNAKFLAMLGDQKNGRNLEAPEGLIRQIVREESGNNNREFILNLKAILECDKKQFGQLSFEGIRLKEQQNGKKYFVN